MINWIEYPANKPEKEGWYFVWEDGEWNNGIWNGRKWINNNRKVTHFTEINPPSDKPNQPSEYNNC